jgi:hypothetical protein
MNELQGPRPIEPFIRTEEPPGDAIVVVRAGPLTVAKLVEHAARQARLFTIGGEPMVAVSVDLTVAGWALDQILRDRMWSRSNYATSTVAQLRDAGFDLVPTNQAPHYSALLRSSDEQEAAALLGCFGPTMKNPHRRRR